MAIHPRAKEIADYINEKASALEGLGHRAEARELTGLADDVIAGRRSDPRKTKPRVHIQRCLFPKQYIVVRTGLPNPKRPEGRSANRYRRVEMYRTGMSVGAYLAATKPIGGELADLWWDERDNLIKVISPDAFSEMETTGDRIDAAEV